MEFYCICWKSPVIYGQGLHMPIKWMWTLREGWGQPEFTLAPNEMMLFQGMACVPNDVEWKILILEEAPYPKLYDILVISYRLKKCN